MLTPSSLAVLAMFAVPTLCARSVKAVFEDWASAFCTWTNQ